MAEISLLQAIAYGVMGLFLLLAGWRAAAALDLAQGLARERENARRVLRALNDPDPVRRDAAIQQVQDRLTRCPDGPLARLFVELEQGPRDGVAATLARFGHGVLRRVEPVRHRIAQLMRIAAPLGLAFTTLVLAISLTTLDPAAGQGPDGLLAALPLSLVTTVIAMVAVIPLRLVEGHLRHIADDLVATVEALVDTAIAGGVPEENDGLPVPGFDR